MTRLEASISNAKRKMVLAAINSNQYASYLPARAKECANDAVLYAEWLRKNGVQVELSTDGKMVGRVIVDGLLLVDGGCLVR